VLGAIGNKIVDENVALTFTVAATDDDGTVLTYSTSVLPTGATFSAATRTFSWTPTFAQAGDYSVTFTVSDGTTSDTEAITIKVTDANRAPVLGAIGNKTVNENVALTFAVTASDADLNVLTYSTSTLPTGATFNAATRTFSWTPTFTQAGEYLVTFTVSDGTASDSEAITIHVTDTPQGPLPAGTGTFTTLSPIQRQYSDRVLMEATVSPGTTATSVTFQVGTQVLATLPVVNGKASGNVQMLAPQGSRIVTAVFNSSTHTIPNVGRSLLVTKEDARVAYTNPTTLCLCGKASVPITVNVKDMTAFDPVLDLDAGNIDTATVTFVNRTAVTTMGTVAVTPSIDPTTGTATYNFPASALGTATSQTLTVGFMVSGNYTRNNLADNVTITITK
jgi:PKD repeat protein